MIVMGDSGRPLSKESGWWYRKYAPGDTVLEGLENYQEMMQTLTTDRCAIKVFVNVAYD